MEHLFQIPTALGQVHLRGRDTGRPILIIITGAYSEAREYHDAQAKFPTLDVLRAQLPGNHCPPLLTTSVGAWCAAYSEALQAGFPDRPTVAVGASTGALIALGLRAPGVRRIVAVEPPLLTAGAWPLRELAQRAPADGATFLWNVLGVSATAAEPRDYTALLDGLTAPATVLAGSARLEDQASGEPWPSLVSAEARQRLKACPLVRYQEVEGAGHNVPVHGALAMVDAIRAACWAAFVTADSLG